jgi:DNA-binding SARP family transcriptional activator
MEFRILGRSRCRTKAARSPWAGRKPRALLALLLLHPNEVAPVDRFTLRVEE